MSEPLWLTEARKLLGLHEGPGAMDNPAVLKLYEEAGCGHIEHDSTAWCAAFVGAMLKRSRLTLGTQSLAARSYEDWGKALSQPALGCIGVKHRGDKNSWQGHVGFVVAANDKTIWLLGGNQDDQVSIAPFKRAQFTAFRWPIYVDVNTDPLPDHGPEMADAKES